MLDLQEARWKFQGCTGADRPGLEYMLGLNQCCVWKVYGLGEVKQEQEKLNYLCNTISEAASKTVAL